MSAYQQYGRRGFMGMPPVVLNLIIINALFLLATFLFRDSINLYNLLGLFCVTSENFGTWQFVSYMFMHGDFYHLLFNMFALWMFGMVLENVWGPKRFLTFYMVTGIGAGLVQLLVAFIRIQSLEAALSPEQISEIYNNGHELWQQGRTYSVEAMATLHRILNIPTVGASGAVFGILLAFGMLFPNTMIYVFFAIPIKAKYFVLIYGIAELYFGVTGTSDGIAHFAHLGGMVFGYFLIRYWRSKGIR
ncbi:MAG: rhomboid family intramembrane serine protease [Bacteroidales bacterium]|nr:rhomboid family intramembrane serine protease [Bacteroidales bacterium]